MKKSIILIALVTALVSVTSAELYHEIESNEAFYTVNTSIGLECDDPCPVNSWSFTYSIPEQAEVTGVRDSYGEIEPIRNGEELEIETNTGDSREEEVVELVYRVDKSANVNGNGLFTRELDLAGFDNQSTRGVVDTDNLLSGSVSPGYETSYGEELRFEGEGPVNLNLNFGKGFETEYYSFFPENSSDDSNESYELALGTVGRQDDFNKIPVVVLGDEYRQSIYDWSQGEYTQGRIMMRNEEDFKPVLAHETVHALHEEPLNWDRTSSSWFDEGIAKHAENLMREKMYRSDETDQRPGELFGDNVSYTDFDEGIVYTVHSRGDRDELWNYYRSDEDRMKDWRPEDGDREFGYAYSELIVKNYLHNGGELEELYFEPGLVESNEEKWSLYSEKMDLRPCESSSREEFNECLDQINEHEYQIELARPTEDREGLDVQRIDLPERRPENEFEEFSRRGNSFLDDIEFEKLLEDLGFLIESLIDEAVRLWKSY